MSDYLGSQDVQIYGKQRYLNIGDAYEGGYIYYITGSWPNYSGYIISQDEIIIPNACWGCYGIRVVNARGQSVGDGLANTNAIVNEGCGGCGAPVGSAPTAAQATLDYSGSGYTDWWLPSSGDWSQIFANKSSFNFFTSSFGYWTSTEDRLTNDGLYNAYYARYSHPTQTTSLPPLPKGDGLGFRAARAFTTY